MVIADMLTYQARLGGRQQARNKPVSVHLWDKQFVKELEDKWQQHLQRDLAGATHKTYSSQQQQYKEFCVLMKRAQLPEPHTLAQFVVGRAMQGYMHCPPLSRGFMRWLDGVPIQAVIH
jgi:hypothetical protein